MAEDAFGIVGTVIAAAYHVESVVAEGGFGTVYRAHHGGFRAPVALKCLRLPPGLLPEAKQHFLESFRAEAELLFRLSASIPTVVRPLHVDAFTLADGRFVPYMVLEWLEGSTLDALIRKRKHDGQAPFTLKKIVRLLTPVARALERAHNFRGPDGPVSVVHRDLKPENIFIANAAGEELVKILDFGIGKAKSMASQVAGRVSQGNSGIATFTPAYGSPEQWAPKRYGQTGPWTDVWGLALTPTEALVGHAIIDGDPAAIMGTILDPNRRPTPGSEGVIVSDEVEAVFEKALALDPRMRYADAGVFWNELLGAARITSGEVQEVRLPRDARAELGGGPRIERVEQVELSRRPGSARPPAARPGLDVAPLTAMSRPTLDAPPPVGADGLLQLEDDLEVDLQKVSFSPPQAVAAAPVLRPLGPSPAPFPPAVSGAFEVPDLDLAPMSRPLPQRSASGMRTAVAPPVELDDLQPLEMMPGTGLSQSFELDVPSHEIARRPSQPPIALELEPQQPPASLRSAAPQVSVTPPPVVVTAAMPPVVSAPPVAPTSLPPSGAGPPRYETASPAGPQQPIPSYQPTSYQPSSSPVRPAFPVTFLPSESASLSARLLPGAVVLACALLLTILDQVYTAATGDLMSIGPLRTSVLSGLLMVVGVVLCVVRVIRR